MRNLESMKERFLRNRNKETDRRAMAAWLELPRHLLKNIVKYLPLRDKINVSLTCKSWFIAGREYLEKVEINGSSPYGGSWMQYNKQCKLDKEYDLGRQLDITESNLAKETSKLISNLVGCTDGIKSLSIDCTFITTADIRKIIHSQRALEKLTIWNCTVHAVRSPKVSLFVEIVNGIVRHQQSLKSIDISLRLKKLQLHSHISLMCLGLVAAKVSISQT